MSYDFLFDSPRDSDTRMAPARMAYLEWRPRDGNNRPVRSRPSAGEARQLREARLRFGGDCSGKPGRGGAGGDSTREVCRAAAVADRVAPRPDANHIGRSSRTL